MKLGYCTWGMPTVPADTFIPFLSRLGYDGVEITVKPGYTTELSTLDVAERRRIAQMLTDHGLELPAIAGHMSMVEQDPDIAERNRAHLTGTVDLALDWALDGAPPVIDTTVGGASGQWDELKPLTIERVGALVRYGEQRGVVIAIEPHVGELLDTTERVLELLDAIRSPYLKLNFDISHFNVQGVPYQESVAALAPHAVHTHVKSERGRAPADRAHVERSSPGAAGDRRPHAHGRARPRHGRAALVATDRRRRSGARLGAGCWTAGCRYHRRRHARAMG